MKDKKNQAQPEKRKKPVKSMRGVPEYYDECKKRYSISLTSTAHQLLKDLATEKQLSISEFIGVSEKVVGKRGTKLSYFNR